mgnify:FL=1
MEIKTKYNVGDKLWTVKNCKAYEFEVDRIYVSIGKEEKPSVTYYPKDGIISSDSYTEQNCYKSREDLINGL